MAKNLKSFWAWGLEDRLPDEGARRALGEQVAGLLGGEARLAPLPHLERAEVPPSRLIVPPELSEFVTAERQARILHTYGRSYRDVVRGFYGDFSPAPDLVALPRSEEEVFRTLELCEAQQLACIPFGGGTSVVGGVEPTLGPRHRGSVSLDLSALNLVLEVDDVSRAARIQAGATGPALEAQLKRHGLSLRHYPQSFEFSTLGGWLATRAGGHFATLYTHIDDLTESIRMLTPRGLWQSRRLPASGAGPSPDRWALGSEGTLGIITEAWMRVQPRPRFRASASVHFADFASGALAARDVSQAGLYPANCRLLEPAEAFLNGVRADGRAVLLLGFESADHPLEPWMERALALAKGRGGECERGARYTAEETTAAAAPDAAAWRKAFLEAPYLQSALVTLGVMVDTFETACTWDRFEALHGEVKEAVESALQRVCGGGLLTCRFTHVYPDGPAPYFTFFALAREGGELEQWAEVKAAASDALLRAGGTITHHHAVGRTHRPWYDRQRPEPFALALKAAKAALDPQGILNPGVLVDSHA